MSEINFLGQDGKDNIKKKQDNADKAGDFAWTDPAGENQAAAEAADRQSGNLSMDGAVDKIAEMDAVAAEECAPGAGKGIFGFWSKMRSQTKNAANGLGLKEQKETIAEAQRAVSREKSRRKGLLSQAPAARADKAEMSVPDASDPTQWKAAKIIKTNLIQGEEASYIDWKRGINALLRSLFLSIFLLGSVYGAFLLWEMDALNKSRILAVDVENIRQKIVLIEDKIPAVNEFQKKLSLAANLLKTHVYWTNFFKFLENNTLSGIYFTGGFSGDTAGRYTFAALADKYSDATDQVMVFKESDMVADASVSAGQLSEGDKKGGAFKIGFTLELTVKPELFYQ